VGGIAANFWGWRVAFIIAGAPGIIIALIVFLTLKEPRRHHAAATHSPGIGEAFKAIAGKPTFALIALGAAMMSFAGYASSAFSNSYYLRNFDAQLTELGAVFGLKPIGFLGLVFGTISGVAGIFGTMAGGWLADRIGNGNLRVRMVVPAVAALLVVPVAIAGYLMTDAVLAFVLLLIPTVLASMWYGPIYATNQGLVHPRTRATVSALLLFIINIIGLALGPTSVGYLSKMLTESYGYTPGEAIRWALIASTACFVIAAGLFWAARRTIERDTMS
jgi:predicted MFS family arabinose efflux permease